MTDGLTLEDGIGPADFVRAAAQLHPQNLTSRYSTSVGGATKSDFEQLMAGLSRTTLMNSSAIPPDIKLATLNAPLFGRFSDPGELTYENPSLEAYEKLRDIWTHCITICCAMRSPILSPTNWRTS